MEKQLRKNKSRLQIFGSGVIAFTVWTFLKPELLLLTLDPSETVPQIDMSDVDAWESAGSAENFFLVLCLLVAVLIALRLWVGFSARAEGRGKPCGYAYVVFAFLLFFFEFAVFATTVVELIRGNSGDQTVLEVAGALIVDIGSVGTLGETAITAARVKKLAAQLRKEG